MDPSTGAGQRGSAASQYEQFVRARTPALIRTAFLLTGDQQLAEDLVQEALARTHVAWHRLYGSGNAEAYVRKIMYHHQVSIWRRRRVAESLPGTLPDAADSGDHARATANRVVLQRALQELSPRQRAVIVLRYYEDRTEAETADLLGLAVGTVKTLALRGLTRLRAAAADLRDLATDGADR
jgi:RNA polymerase sigma-70 factor (sigma-E family)